MVVKTALLKCLLIILFTDNIQKGIYYGGGGGGGNKVHFAVEIILVKIYKKASIMVMK